jgi:orotate phosphoribosyltransferase-like protein
LIVGVPRSGMLPKFISTITNIPYSDSFLLNGHIYKAGARGQFFDISAFKNILVVDDSIASGSAMIEVKESLEHLSDQFNINIAQFMLFR